MSTFTPLDSRVRRRVRVLGVVQGVGFRPFVYRLAGELALDGHVGNDTEGVLIEVEGPAGEVRRFEQRLVLEAPSLSRITGVKSEPVSLRLATGFRILESHGTGAVRTFASPDVAVCSDCLAELFDPADRRYRYPFINCTNCGPRFTIILRLPYDRPNTTMCDFALCRACAAEYGDPADRRFHAQPVACAACGPRLWFEGRDGVVEGGDAAIAAAQDAIARGEIVAVKGLGGYHLACDGASDAAIGELRARKDRPAKPFAVMVRDLDAARALAVCTPDEATLLAGPERPIVLLARRRAAPVAESVAPDNPLLGILLPYTPLHHLLFSPVPDASATVPQVLVMTSGNLSDEPIAYEDADARRRLGRIADAWLVHDRPIHVPCDDSVVRIADGAQLPIRRSRGYSPLPIRLPFDVEPLLAAGGELKNAFCIASGRDAWMSQHIGDMGTLETLEAFERSTRQFEQMYNLEPERIVADSHPGYQTRRWVEERGGRPTALVQHHHAHIAAVMAEHGVGRHDQVIGCAFDGTGFGTDGAIWGGEFLVAGYDTFRRAAHLRYVGLPGGDATIRKPYRAALAHLHAAGITWTEDLAPVRAAAPGELAVLARQLQRGVGCVPTSSMGRLFDAVSSILDLRHTVSYEAQAAIELEAIAGDHPAGPARYRFARRDGEIDPAPVLCDIVRDLRAGCPIAMAAAGFHQAVASLLVEAAEELRSETGIATVALSGGVFQNILLVRSARSELGARGFRVLTHRIVPPNDGGLALGQAAVAGSRRPMAAPA